MEAEQNDRNNFVSKALSFKDIVSVQEQNCELSPIDVNTAARDFTALQYALFIALFVQVKLPISNGDATKQMTRHFHIKNTDRFLARSPLLRLRGGSSMTR